MRRRKSLWLGCGVLALGLAACVGGSKSGGSAAADREKLKAYVLDAPPADIPTKLDINYEGKVRLIGAKIEPMAAKPGSEVKLTLYWKAEDKLDEGWQLFTHILDASGDRILNIDNVGPLRDAPNGKQTLPPGSWEKGKVYADEQTFTVPDTKSPEIQIVTGIWKGDARLKVTGGPGDKENRGIVARLKTGVAAAAPAHSEIPTIRPAKLAAEQKVTIDGKLDEEAWKSAANTGPFVDVGTGNPNTSFPVHGSAKVVWDDQNLYVGFVVKDPDLVGGFPKDAKDPHLWEKDTVEIMVDPDGDGDNADYYEIQINPQNLVFDTQYDGYNTPKKDPNGPFGHEEWSAKLKSAVTLDGTLDKPGDKDGGYTVEAAIPWSSFSKAKKAPPGPGDAWRMNLYTMQNNSGVAWSPILGQGNFHKASRFGRVVWTVPGVVPPPAASASAAAPSASARMLRIVPPRLQGTAP